MIGMTVREDDSINMVDAVVQTLQPELRSGIDLHRMTINHHMYTGASTPVAWISLVETRVRVGHQGYTLGSPASEHGDFHAAGEQERGL